MSEQTPGPSGSRWEPTPDDETAHDDSDAPAAYDPMPEPPAQTGYRHRAALAGGALAVLLVGGAGGFALGSATASGDTPDQRQRQMMPGQQSGFSGEGQPPGMPGMPGMPGDPDGDGDQHGFQGGQGAPGGPGGQLPDSGQNQPGTTSGQGESTT